MNDERLKLFVRLFVDRGHTVEFTSDGEEVECRAEYVGDLPYDDRVTTRRGTTKLDAIYRVLRVTRLNKPQLNWPTSISALPTDATDLDTDRGLAR